MESKELAHDVFFGKFQVFFAAEKNFLFVSATMQTSQCILHFFDHIVNGTAQAHNDGEWKHIMQPIMSACSLFLKLETVFWVWTPNGNPLLSVQSITLDHRLTFKVKEKAFQGKEPSQAAHPSHPPGEWKWKLTQPGKAGLEGNIFWKLGSKIGQQWFFLIFEGCFTVKHPTKWKKMLQSFHVKAEKIEPSWNCAFFAHFREPPPR